MADATNTEVAEVETDEAREDRTGLATADTAAGDDVELPRSRSASDRRPPEEQGRP